MESVYVIAGIVGIATAFVAALIIAAVVGARTRRTVWCPADGKEAHVRCDPVRAAKAMFSGERDKVSSCSRWPEHEDCDRACEEQLR